MFLAGCPAGGDLPTGGGGSGGGGGGTGGAGNYAPVACSTPVNPGSGGSPPTWDTIKRIIESCVGADCHETREPMLIAADPNLYTVLRSYKTKLGKCGGRDLVVPCDPDASAFFRAQAATCETLAQMPFGCFPGESCTSDADLEAIRQWILMGTPK